MLYCTYTHTHVKTFPSASFTKMGIEKQVIDFFKGMVSDAFSDTIPSGVTRVTVDMNASIRKLPPCKSMMKNVGDSVSAIDYNYEMTREELLERFCYFLKHLWNRYPNAQTFALVYDKKSPALKKTEQVKRSVARKASHKKRNITETRFEGIRETTKFTVNALMTASYVRRAETFRWLAEESADHVVSLKLAEGRCITMIHDYAMGKPPIIVNPSGCTEDTVSAWKNDVYEGEVACVMHAVTKWSKPARVNRTHNKGVTVTVRPPREVVAIESIDTDTLVIIIMHLIKGNRDNPRTSTKRKHHETVSDETKDIVWVRSTKRTQASHVNVSMLARELQRMHPNSVYLKEALFLTSVICKNDFCPGIKRSLTNGVNARTIVEAIFNQCVGLVGTRSDPLRVDVDMVDLLTGVNPKIRKLTAQSHARTKKGMPTAAARRAETKHHATIECITEQTKLIRGPLLYALWDYWTTFKIAK